MRVESARMAAKPPIPIGVMHASVPPQIIASASPRWISRYESPIECALVVHAVHQDVPFTAAMTAEIDQEIAALADWLELDLRRQG